MRVISGSKKGSPLLGPDVDFVRPTTDKVKEAVFSILAPHVPGARFLDLFAGSGGMGIEALSRGAESAVFVDSYRGSFRLIRQNLDKLKLDSTVLYSDAVAAIKKLAAEEKKFDIVYIDPPFQTELDKAVLSALAKFDITSENVIIIVEHKGKKDLVNLDSPFILESERRYGAAYLSFFVRKDAARTAQAPTEEPPS